jgi:enediyne biosynthesis protein E4
MMMRLTMMLCLCAGMAHAEGPVVPRFVEEGAAAGITGFYAGEWQYMVGGGVGVFDCNADGFEDMVIAGGERPATFYLNTSAKGGVLKFVPTPSGLEFDAVTGAYPLDANGDGIMDVALLRVGENQLMRGTGNCQFVPANADWGFDGGDGWSVAFAATWEHGANWPTLAVGNYINRAEEDFPWGSCTDNWLHRGADGRFAAPLPLTPSYCALSMLFSDWNRSGTPALRVSNDREYYKGGQEQMWSLQPGQPPVLLTEADGWKKLRVWGMGLASSDVTNDGYPDYYVTSMADNKLQALSSVEGAIAPSYGDVAFAKGITAHRPYTGGDLKPSTGWHAQFGDVNNDGMDDLFVAKGNVAAMPDFALLDPNNLLLQGADGKFIESGEAAGVDSMAISRGAQLADFNMDGLLDIVVVNRWEAAQLYRNTSVGTAGFAALRLHQPGVNPDGVGAFVELRRGDAVAQQEITVGGGHASGRLGWIHFGLGDATVAEVRVTWPDGTIDDWQPVLNNAFQVLERGAAPVQWAQP